MRHPLIVFLFLLGCAPSKAPVDEDSDSEPIVDDPDLLECHPDDDGDGFGDAARAFFEEAPSCSEGRVLDGSDCDDTDAGVHPGAMETCDGRDEDCNRLTDDVSAEAPESGGAWWYADGDEDGYGDPEDALFACAASGARVGSGGDCDDTDPTVHPDARETCGDEIDQDCDLAIDEFCPAICGDDLASDLEDCDGADDAACPGLCSPLCACPALPPGELELHFIDVGHGDSILVVSPDGFTLLIDAGLALYQYEVLDYLEALGLPRLDYVMASHGDSDHVGGIDAVLEDWPDTRVCFYNGMTLGSSAWGEFAEACGDRLLAVEPGAFDWLGPTLNARVLHASVGDLSDENQNSIVLRLEHGDFSVLLGGDCPTDDCEDTLVAEGIEPVTLYKVHHHGLSDASSDALLDLLQPSLAVIPNETWDPILQAGARLLAHGVEIYQTAVHGDIFVATDGSRITLEHSE